MNLHVKMSEMVGGGYTDFWRFTGHYRVVKGSRGSKKSKTMALWLIAKMHRYPTANTLVIRKTFRSLKDSCFTELKWAINRLNLNEYWKVTESPLEITRIDTGQKIYFRGLDDPLKVTSITVETGSLCWLWIEEAYEITKESDFDMIDESIRGQVSDGLFKQITMTFNPWNEKHWIKKRFFDVKENETVVSELDNGLIKRFADEDGENVDTLTLTTNYKCNEWLDKSDLAKFNRMKNQNPRRYNVAGLGNWGVVEGVIFDNWREEAFDVDEIRKMTGIKSAFGLDFGYTNHPTALFCGMVDSKNKQLYVFDEMYSYNMSNERIYEKIVEMGYSKERIIGDSAEPKSIDRLETLGLHGIRKARKGKDSISHGIDYLQDYEIIVHPRCANFITEINNYTWDEDKFGNKINKPIDDFNHLMDAMRYAMEYHSKGSTFGFD